MHHCHQVLPVSLQLNLLCKSHFLVFKEQVKVQLVESFELVTCFVLSYCSLIRTNNRMLALDLTFYNNLLTLFNALCIMN